MTDETDELANPFESAWHTSSSFIRRVSTAFDHAEELSDAKRAEYLEALQRDDPKVAQRLEQILDTNADVDGFFDSLLSSEPPADGASGLVGQTLGGYRLLEQVGEGGMGIVYRACNENEALDQQVAIKVLRQRWLSSGIEIRFAREAQILVNLDHPNIARIHNVGTHDGYPYLIMEYVDGEQLDTYCNRRKLDVEQRLGLFATAVDAVAHAQSKAIIHRDLKPRNILVTGEGQVKLLDFGIAKILSGDASAPSDLTQLLGQLVSPEVAAPEQWRNEAQTMATDVYALGVVLFKLLCGQYPFDRDEISTSRQEGRWPRRLPTMQQSIERADQTGRAGDLYGISERERHQAVRGDLQAIVSKATAVEPNDRYAFAAQLFDDVQRYLDKHPVEAARSRMLHSMRQWIARHRVRAGLLAGLGLALSLMMVQTVVDARKDRRYAAQIRAERDKAQAVATLFRESLGAADPDVEGAHEITVREALLSTGTKVIDDENTADATRIELALSLGQTLSKLNAYVDARPLFELALKLASASSGPAAAKAKTDALLGLVSCAVQTGQYEAAKAQYDLAYEAVLSNFDQPSERMMNLLNDRTLLYTIWDAPDRHLEAAREAHAYALAHPELSARPRANAINNLALALRDTRPLPEIIVLLEEARDLVRSELPAGHPEISSLTTNLAAAHLTAGNTEAAEEAYLSVIKTINMQGVRPNTAMALAAYGLGATRMRQGRFNEALEPLIQALELREGIFGPAEFRSIHTRYAIATNLALMGRNDEALQEFTAVKLALQAHHPDTYLMHGLELRLAAYDIDAGNISSAERYLDSAEKRMESSNRVTQTEREFLRVMRWFCSPTPEMPDWVTQTARSIEERSGVHALPALKIRDWLSAADVPAEP